LIVQITMLLAQSGFLKYWHGHTQESETITLLLGLTGVIVARRLFDFTSRPAARALMAGFWVMITAYVCTILEGFFPEASFGYKAFDLAEHSAYAVSAWLFAIGVRSLVAERKAGLLSDRMGSP
jgi:hypothetical protein